MQTLTPIGKALLVAAIAVAYFLTAELGFLLTVPPGNVTPLWPPSGIAVAAAFVFGRYCLPGVWIGSFFVNALTMTGDNALYVTFAIACGSTIQAGLTTFALQRYLPMTLAEKQDRYPTPDSAQSVILFVVLSGICATTAPTIGVTALTLGGYIAQELYISVWLTWWLGDYAGILTIAPVLIVLTLKLKQRPVAEETLFPLSTLWFGLSLIVFFVVFQLERRENDAKLHSVAISVQQRLEAFVRATQLNLLAMSGFFGANTVVEPQQYTSFVAPLLKDNSEIIGINWVPYVPATRLQNWLEHDGKLANISTLFEMTESTRLPQPISSRADYFPIMYLEPKLPQYRLEGLDLGADPVRRATLERARDSDDFVVSAPLTLYRDAQRLKGHLLAVPVYHTQAHPATIEERRAAIKGFAVAVLNAKSIANAIQISHAQLDIDISVASVMHGLDPQIVYESTSPEAPQKAGRLIEESVDISVGDQIWRLHVSTHEPYFSALTWRSWLLLLFGFVMSSIVTIYINIRRKADRALRESEKFSRALFDSAPDAGFVISQSGRIIRLNTVANTLFGYDTDELVNHIADSLIDLSDRKQLSDARENFFASPTACFPISERPIMAIRKDGSSFPVEALLCPIKFGKEIMAIVNFRDVTEREHHIREIEQLNESLELRVHERTVELEDAQRELTVMVTSLEQKNREISALSELSEYLDSSTELEEVEITLQQFLPHLFSGTRGQVFFNDDNNKRLRPSVSSVS